MTQYATFNGQRVQVIKRYNKLVTPPDQFPQTSVPYAQIGYLDGDSVGETDEVPLGKLVNVTESNPVEAHA